MWVYDYNGITEIETALDGVRAGAKRLGRKRKLSPARYATYMEHQKSPRPYVCPSSMYLIAY